MQLSWKSVRKISLESIWKLTCVKEEVKREIIKCIELNENEYPNQNLWLYSFPIFAVANHHKHSGLKQHKFISLQLGDQKSKISFTN